ncbi:glycine receptor subunit alpha-2-like protein [Leptotrombidium deliense]|uniref:Glycine receptor subunit alpha-2-like protein n=1 Tax=Leptotrombidium deliense TaxID=299467 RepID=A0A443S177_9ACAR|nr:glycine receptor subunit alpha-2-like protein [Leptotrombidium deliense]
MVQSYLPTVLIVAISWVSFWLDVDAIPARVTLGVTTLLTISSKGAFIQSNLPPVSYVKAIDVWMGACTIFVFTALLEFTVVNYLWRKGGGGVIVTIPQSSSASNSGVKSIQVV